MAVLKLQVEKAGLLETFKKHINDIKKHKDWLMKDGTFKNFERRFTFDILHLLKGTAWMCECYNKYNCNDDNLFAVGKACLKELGVI